MIRALALLVLALVALGCNGQTPAQLSAEERASVVIMASEIAEDNETIIWAPVCGGTAISASEILTAGHCAPEAVVWFVDADLWLTTSGAMRRAAVEQIPGDLAILTPSAPLAFFAATGQPRDGEALLVRLSGTEFESVPAVLSGFDLDSPPVDHGNSGSGLFQGGPLVGTVLRCNSSNDQDCDTPGGTFIPPPAR